MLLVVLSHLDPEGVERQLAYLDRLLPGSSAVVAYGGKRERFAGLDASRSVFIEDPSLRGPIRGQSYNEVLLSAHERFVRDDPSIGWVHLIEWDHVPLVPDYAERLVALAEVARADVVGKNLVERSQTNWPHALHAREDRALQALLDRISVRDSHEHAIYGGLGNGWLIRRTALEAFAALEGHVHGYVELYVPTVMHHLGFHLADYTALGHGFDHVRFSPPYSVEEVLTLRGTDALAAHPVKDPTVWGRLG